MGPAVAGTLGRAAATTRKPEEEKARGAPLGVSEGKTEGICVMGGPGLCFASMTARKKAAKHPVPASEVN